MIATRLGVGVGSGSGFVARRRDGILFASANTFAGWPGIVSQFLQAPDVDAAREAVTDGAVDASFVIDPFTMITWADVVHVHVLGDVSLTTDLPTLPMLSGRGSASWVEHRAPRSTQHCRLWLGTEPSPVSDLASGVVPADGFVLELGPGVEPASEPPRVDQGQAAPQSHPAPAPAPAPAPESTPPPDLTVPVARGSRSGLEALHAATDGDWMEDSLGLPALADALPPLPAALAGHGGDDFDPEITLEPLAVSVAAPQTIDDDPASPQSAMGDPRRHRTVQARRCPKQHVNAPSAALCRVCQEPIMPGEPLELVPQPALGSLILPDGRTVPIDGALVFGRNPTFAAARVDEAGTLWSLDVGNDVSRTHVVVRANGWMLEAIDCASSGQTVLVSALTPRSEPTMLEPWVPHELSVGDVLYLGGPTQLRVTR